MNPTPLLMHRLLDRSLSIAPEEEIVTLWGESVHRQSYRQTHHRARQLANALTASGIVVGDRVASFMWNNYRHLELYIAVPSMGAVLHTLNIRLSSRELVYIINHAQDSVVIVDEDILAQIVPVIDQVACVKTWVVCAEQNNWRQQYPELNAVDYEDFIAGHSSEISWPQIDEHSPMGLCYTSGTTGNPKGVMYTQRSTYLHTITQCMTDALGVSAVDAICGIVPMFHAMGWGLPFSASMLGAKQVMPHKYMAPQQLLNLLADEKVTLSAGVPTIWQGVQAEIEQHPQRWDLSQLRRLTCGGSAPPIALMRWYYDQLNIEMLQGWGMTETNPLGTVSPMTAKHAHHQLSEDEKFENVQKAGLLMPGLEMKIVDENFETLANDGVAVGELLVKGPWVCTEYYNDPQPTKFHQGWLITGDMAKIDSEGYLIICDRSKDLIKSGGEWISSVDIENHIVGVAGIAMAAVVAQPHPKWDERPVAICVLEPGQQVSAAAVIEHCAGEYAKWQLPDEVLFWLQLPLTSTGKIDKKNIRAQLQQQQYQLPDLRS